MGRGPTADSGTRVRLFVLRQAWRRLDVRTRSAKLTVTFASSSRVSPYAFGTRTATFHVCAQCGIVPLVTSEIENQVYAVVNVNVLENVDPSWLRRAAANFEGEESNRASRGGQRNWIADVRVADPGAGSK